MYILLILFFTSLILIIFMIGRKLILLQNGLVVNKEEVLFKIPHLEKIKNLTIENAKKYGHLGLVTTLRLYVRSINFLKNKYQETKIKIENWNKENHINGEKKEISKFLKIIGDYKHKIREIKNKIHEEEKNS